MSFHIYKSPDALAEGLAEWIAGNICLRLQTKKRYTFVLSGGSTPQQLYRVLAMRYAHVVDWQRVDFFWGDERFVPAEDERNNANMVRQLLLKPLKIDEGQIFPMPVEGNPQAAAKKYQHILEAYFSAGTPSFDFVLLGMGADAHTLSLFPGWSPPDDHGVWVAATYNEGDHLDRITLLPSIVNRSQTISFMVQGTDKAATLQKVLQEKSQPVKYPSQMIDPANENLMWFIDTKSASEIMQEK